MEWRRFTFCTSRNGRWSGGRAIDIPFTLNNSKSSRKQVFTVDDHNIGSILMCGEDGWERKGVIVFCDACSIPHGHAHGRSDLITIVELFCRYDLIEYSAFVGFTSISLAPSHSTQQSVLTTNKRRYHWILFSSIIWSAHRRSADGPKCLSSHPFTIDQSAIAWDLWRVYVSLESVEAVENGMNWVALGWWVAVCACTWYEPLVVAQIMRLWQSKWPNQISLK